MPNDLVRIANPKSIEQTILRRDLLPDILAAFEENTSAELPQEILEIGSCSQLDADSETGASDHLHLAAGIIGPKADFSGGRAAVESLLHEFGCTLQCEPITAPGFLPGRVASLIACGPAGRAAVGILGEFHPQVLENFKLVYPVVAFEADLEKLNEIALSPPSQMPGDEETE